jgi:hypothetical protein
MYFLNKTNKKVFRQNLSIGDIVSGKHIDCRKENGTESAKVITFTSLLFWSKP